MAWTKEARQKALETRNKKGHTNQFTKAKKEGRKIVSSLKGKSHPGHPHTEETKQLLREKALKSNHRRLLRSTVKYLTKNGEVILLDSSWEVTLAKRLDEMNVEWIRPEPLKWIDKTGKKRNYFPDFYLPKYDLYLDPKNPAAVRQQHEKIQWLIKNVKNLIIFYTLDDVKKFSPCS